jgi:hypothetical protein
MEIFLDIAQCLDKKMYHISEATLSFHSGKRKRTYSGWTAD